MVDECKKIAQYFIQRYNLWYTKSRIFNLTFVYILLDVFDSRYRAKVSSLIGVIQRSKQAQSTILRVIVITMS